MIAATATAPNQRFFKGPLGERRALERLAILEAGVGPRLAAAMATETTSGYARRNPTDE